MTKFCFITMLILTILSCNNASQTTIGVHVEGVNADVKPLVITQDSTYEVALDSTGSAAFIMAENLKPGYAKVKYGRMMFPVYIEPGKSFDLSIKMENRRATPYFTGEGAKVNEYLNSGIFRSSNPDFKAEESAFIASLEEQVRSLHGNLDTMGFAPAFNQLEKKRIHYFIYSVLPMYPSYYAYYAQDTAYEASGNYYNTLKSAITEEEALIDMDEYQEALTGLVQVYASKDMKEHDALQMVKNELDYVEKNFTSPVIAGYLVDKFVSGYVGNSGVDNLAELAPVYNAKVTCPAKKAKFDELCGKWAKIAKGQPAPSFKYLDIDGQEVSLSDLAGKYVYIDVWATWCGPCRGELPSLRELEHQLKGKNINFVSISCDQDKAAWEKMVKEEKLEGIQLHDGGDQSFMESFMIRGIPRFILLDREGNIVSSNMTRPSNKQTAETLNALEGI